MTVPQMHITSTHCSKKKKTKIMTCIGIKFHPKKKIQFSECVIVRHRMKPQKKPLHWQTNNYKAATTKKNDWIWKIKQWEAIATGNVCVDTFISAATFNETAVIWQNKKTGFFGLLFYMERQNAWRFQIQRIFIHVFLGLKDDRRVVIRKPNVWSFVRNIYR